MNQLHWVQQKSEATSVDAPIQSVRAFYLTLARAIVQSNPLNSANVLARILVLDLDLYQNRNLNRELALDLVHAIEMHDGEDLGLDLELDLSLALEYAQDLDQPDLAKALAALIKVCPEDTDSDRLWLDWANNLRQEMVKYRNIGQDWQLDADQLEVIHQYCEANRLLVECLESDCYVSQSVRQAIEKSLLLPV